MKKIITILSLPLWLLSSCNSDKVSESDLSGKTFSAKLLLTPSQKKNDEFESLSRLLASGNTQMEYKFNDDHTMDAKGTTGMMIISVPYTWSLNGDSLELVMTSSKLKRTNLIKKEAKGVYSLKESEEISTELTLKGE